MADHKSAAKRHRQSEKKRIRNASFKSTIRTSIKDLRDSIDGNNTGEAEAQLKQTVKLLDCAVTKGVLHRRSASRRISRLTVAVNSAASK